MDQLDFDLLRWSPSRRVFLRRVSIAAIVTFLCLAAIAVGFATYSPLPYGWAIVVAFTLTLGFVFEDLTRWRGLRYDVWLIESGQLVHDGPEGRSHLPLSEIVSVKTQFSSRVIVQLNSGQRIAIRYLTDPTRTASLINAARGSLTE